LADDTTTTADSELISVDVIQATSLEGGPVSIVHTVVKNSGVADTVNPQASTSPDNGETTMSSMAVSTGSTGVDEVSSVTSSKINEASSNIIDVAEQPTSVSRGTRDLLMIRLILPMSLRKVSMERRAVAKDSNAYPVAIITDIHL